MPTSVFGGTFYNDSTDNLGQISPGFSPHNGMNFPNDGDDRRPSIASATTVSSTGSKSSVSGKFHKKLQGFFGDEYKGLDESSRQGSESNSMQGSRPGLTPTTSNNHRGRNNSVNDGAKGSSPPSPSSSRPRTPAQQGPSYDVTPWAFQDSQVSRRDGRGRRCPAEMLTRVLHRTTTTTRRFLQIRVTAATAPNPPPIRACTCPATDTTEVMKRSRAPSKDLLHVLQPVESSRMICDKALLWLTR